MPEAVADPREAETPPTDHESTPAEDDAELDRELVRHVKRPQWGLAILAWEKNGRRAYQFEDGRLRKFKKGYYSLLQPAEDVEGSPEAIIQRLEASIGANKGKPPPKPQEAVAPFKAQVELFEELYPKGFNDPKWIDDHRRGEGRVLKRHREPVIEMVRDKLGADAVEDMIEREAHDELVNTVLDVLASTNLVSISRVKALRGIEPEETRQFAEVIRFLLHGEQPFSVRFRRYLAALRGLVGRRPSWRFATALPALRWPEEQVCVRRSAFLRQAGSIAPTARYSQRARIRSYENFKRVAKAVREKLEAAGHEPRDLLDVHDFIWATLRKSALENLGTE